MYTEQLAGLICRTAYERLPIEAIQAAKWGIFDCLGVCIAGSFEPASTIVASLVEDIGGAPEAGVIARGFKTAAPLAALANGTFAHALDYDDVAWTWLGHPSAVILPTVLALGHSRRATGKQVIVSYIIGLETAAKLGPASGNRQHALGWHSTATLGTVGAAAAAAKMLSLDLNGTARAIGIAASMASGLVRVGGTMTKPFHAGHAAQNGVMASLLAERGFIANSNALDGDRSFLKVFNAGGEVYPEKLVEGFGDPWDVVSPGLTLKSYPSCRSTHPAIDAALYLRQMYNIDTAGIREIRLHTSPMVPQILQHHSPENGAQGRFSLEYCVAVALLEGDVKLKHFAEPGWFAKPEVKALVALSRYVYPEGYAMSLELPQKVVVAMADGTEYSREVAVHDTKGDPENAMTEAEMVAKYRDCAASSLSSSDIERSLEMVAKLENLEDISQLMHLVMA